MLGHLKNFFFFFPNFIADLVIPKTAPGQYFDAAQTVCSPGFEVFDARTLQATISEDFFWYSHESYLRRVSTPRTALCPGMERALTEKNLCEDFAERKQAPRAVRDRFSYGFSVDERGIVR